MRLNAPFMLQTLVTDDTTDCPADNNIFETLEELKAARPSCEYIRFGFRIIDKEANRIPDGMAHWYNTLEAAYADYVQKTPLAPPDLPEPETRTSRKGDIAMLTRDPNQIEIARNELLYAANLLQALLDKKIYQTDICQKLDMTPTNLHRQTINLFRPYIRTRLETINGLCRRLENLRTPGDRLLLAIFDEPVPPDEHTVLLLPPYDEEELWNTVYEHLTQREYRIVQIIHGTDTEKPETLRVAAETFHISHARVRDIYCKAIRKLRHPDVLKKIYPAMTTTYVDIENIILRNAKDAFQRYKDVQEEYERQGAISRGIGAYLQGKTPDENTKVQIGDKPSNLTKEIVLADVFAKNNISVRLFNCLHRADIRTLNQLIDMPIRDLKHIRNLGRSSLREIHKLLEQYFNISRQELLT